LPAVRSPDSSAAEESDQNSLCGINKRNTLHLHGTFLLQNLEVLIKKTSQHPCEAGKDYEHSIKG